MRVDSKRLSIHISLPISIQKVESERVPKSVNCAAFDGLDKLEISIESIDYRSSKQIELVLRTSIIRLSTDQIE